MTRLCSNIFDIGKLPSDLRVLQTPVDIKVSSSDWKPDKVDVCGAILIHQITGENALLLVLRAFSDVRKCLCQRTKLHERSFANWNEIFVNIIANLRRIE